MTPEQRQTLHRILLDAKAGIKDGELLDDTFTPCSGICDYVKWSKNGSPFLRAHCENLYKKSPLYYGSLWVATPLDFSHPDRLALLDWLINETKP